jgi:hypothetical protein
MVSHGRRTDRVGALVLVIVRLGVLFAFAAVVAAVVR